MTILHARWCYLCLFLVPKAGDVVIEENGEPVLVIPGPEVSDSAIDAGENTVVEASFDGYIDMETGKHIPAPK